MIRLSRRLGFVAAAVLVAALTTAAGVPKPSTLTTWRDRAIAAVQQWHAVDDQDPSLAAPLALSHIGLAEATLYGWDYPDVAVILARLMALRNPDGGWGLNATADAFGDGTVNPATTSYTVTMADHVGPFLLGAYQHGLIGVEPLTTIGSILVHLPQWTLFGGVCVPYSTSPNDQVNSGQCVHNSSAAVGLFLTQLWQANVGVPGATTLRGLIVKTETAAYNVAAKNWWYAENGHGYFGTPYNDADHESLDVEAMLTEAPSLGYLPQVYLMLNAFPNDPSSPLAHFRLGYSRCVSADQWFGEFDTWLANPPSSTRLAQMARWAARDSAVCEA